MLLNSADANGGLDDTNPSSNPNPSPSPSSSPHPSLSPNSNPIPNQALYQFALEVEENETRDKPALNLSPRSAATARMVP